MPTEIKVPTLGESVTTATIARWLKKGAIPSPPTSRWSSSRPTRSRSRSTRPPPACLRAIIAKEGAEVEVGGLLGEISESGAATGNKAQPAAAAKPAAVPAAPPAAPAPAPAKAAPAPATSGIEIKVPTLGESVTTATVSRWLKQEGDTVAVDEPLVELETDKVSVEVGAPSAGVLSSIRVRDGARSRSRRRARRDRRCQGSRRHRARDESAARRQTGGQARGWNKRATPPNRPRGPTRHAAFRPRHTGARFPVCREAHGGSRHLAPARSAPAAARMAASPRATCWTS